MMNATIDAQLSFEELQTLPPRSEEINTADDLNPSIPMKAPADTAAARTITCRRRCNASLVKAIPASASMSIEALLTFAEAAKHLGISLRQFRRLVDAGKIGFVKISERSPRIRPSELHRFLDASAVNYSEVQP
jgi:excisionase family DNA binding protein